MDFEFSFRLKKNGIPIFLVSNAVLDHKLGDKTVKVFRKVHSFHSPIRRYYIFRNHFYLLSIYGKDFPLQLSKMTLSRFFYFFTIIFLGDKRIDSVRYVIKGVLDFIRGVTGKVD